MTHSEGAGWTHTHKGVRGTDTCRHIKGGTDKHTRRNAQEGGTQKRTIYVTDRQTQTHRQRFI